MRQWCTLRTWEWFKLYGKVKPLLKAGKEGEEIDKLNSKISELEENLGKEEKLRKELENNNTKLLEEKNALFTQLEGSKGTTAETEERLQKLNSQKADLDKQVAELNDKLGEQEDRNNDVSRAKKKLEPGRRSSEEEHPGPGNEFAQGRLREAVQGPPDPLAPGRDAAAG